MKFQVERKNFLAGMQRVAGVVEKRNTMPILSHVLITAAQETISLFATDLEIGICDDYPAQVERPGRITTSARKLLEIVHQLPEGPVKIQQLDNNWISIESGNAYFKIAGLPPEEFPAPSVPEGEAKMILPPSLLSMLIGKTIFAVGENDPRYILNGVLIQMQKISDAKSTIRMVATDGHRLALAEGMVKRPKEWASEESVILPKKAILEIKRVLDEVKPKEKSEGAAAKGGTSTEKEKELEMTLGKGLLALKYGTLLLTSRLMHGNYPTYQQVIPKDNDKKVSTNRAALFGALSRVAILSREKTHTIEMRVGEGEMVLHSNNPELGEAREHLATSFKGESFSTMFSARYLLDLLAALDHEEVTFEFKDASSSCLVREDFNRDTGREGGKFLSIVMPLRD